MDTANYSLSAETSLATLLPGYLRVPLAWYQSSTHAAHDDETAAMIARVYEDSSAECTQRRFCGYCGTSLTYWCENPLSEAKFILITLGSLKAQHLNDLADMGFVSVGSDGPDVLSEAPEKMDTSPITTKEPLLTGVPWFDALIQDSPLRKMQHGVITKQTLERTIRVEWEISEWIDDASIADTCVDEGEGGMEWTASQAANKRKLQDLE